jgi:ribonucleoside-diphosphate reductase alpha chain
MMSRHWKPPADDDGQGINTKARVGDQELYILVSQYPNGDPARVQIIASKRGSIVHGLLAAIAILITLCLQNGVTTTMIAEKLDGLSFEPDGFTNNKLVKTASSIPDFIGKWLAARFPPVMTEMMVENTEKQEVGYDEDDQ